MRLKRGPLVVLLALSALSGVTRAADFSTYTGAELYKRFCGACHGVTGEGNGPVAASFKIMVPDLTLIARRQGGQFPAERIHRIIDGRLVPAPHGSREMPIWGWEFASVTPDGSPDLAVSDAMVARLVEHLRSIQKP